MRDLRWRSATTTDTTCSGRMNGGEYSVYILRCGDGSLYTGIATDVARRLQEHASGPRGAKYLRGRGPLTLEFQELVGGRSDASRVEYYVKNLPKPDKEMLVAGRKSLAELLQHQASGVAGG